MTLFDLLFILVFFGAVAGLLAASVAALRGNAAHALRRLRTLGIGLAAYMGVVTATSLLSTRRVLALGEPACSDDWCITVTDIVPMTIGDGGTHQAIFELSSRARRTPQRERFVVAYMLDAAGRRYDDVPSEGEAPFDREMGPGESLRTPRFFRVPGDATGLGVVVGREGDFAIPRCCIIGLGPFYKPPIWYMQ